MQSWQITWETFRSETSEDFLPRTSHFCCSHVSRIMQTIVKFHIWEGTKSWRQLTIKRPSTPSSPKTDQKHLSESVETAQTNPRSGPAMGWRGASRSAAASQKTFARGNFEHCCGIQKNRKQTFTYVSYVVYLQTAGTQTSKSCLCFPGSHSWHWPVQRTVDWPQRIHRQKTQSTHSRSAENSCCETAQLHSASGISSACGLHVKG